MDEADAQNRIDLNLFNCASHKKIMDIEMKDKGKALKEFGTQTNVISSINCSEKLYLTSVSSIQLNSENLLGSHLQEQDSNIICMEDCLEQELCIPNMEEESINVDENCGCVDPASASHTTLVLTPIFSDTGPAVSEETESKTVDCQSSGLKENKASTEEDCTELVACIFFDEGLGYYVIVLIIVVMYHSYCYLREMNIKTQEDEEIQDWNLSKEICKHENSKECHHRMEYEKISSSFAKTFSFINFSNTILLVYSMFVVITPGSSSVVTLRSDKPVVTEGGRITFTCRGFNIASISWYLDGTLYTDSDLRDVRITFNDASSNFPDTGILTFQVAHLEYNNKSIYCVASLTSGNIVSSDVAIIKVQGFLPAVKYDYTVSKNNITVRWDHVFTWDIPDVEPDVSYCVTIYDSSGIWRSECNIADNYAYYLLPDNFACGTYNLTVDAVNILGRTNSTSVPIKNKDLYISHVGVTSVKNAEEVSNFKEVSIVMEQYLCTDSVSLIINGNTTSITIKNSSILQFTMFENNKFQATIQDLNNSVSNVTTQITTYDVNKTVITNGSETNELLLHTTFITNSLARGVLYLFLNFHNNILNFSKSFYKIKSKADAENGTSDKFPGGTYRVLSYDVEENYTIQNHGDPADVQDNVIVADYFFSEFMSDDTECERVVMDKFNVTVRCNCPPGSYYQVIFQKYYNGSLSSADAITTKRATCTDIVSFPCDNNAVCHIMAFPENMFRGILLNPNDETISTLTPNDDSVLRVPAVLVSVIVVISVFIILMVPTVAVNLLCIRRKKTPRLINNEKNRNVMIAVKPNNEELANDKSLNEALQSSNFSAGQPNMKDYSTAL